MSWQSIAASETDANSPLNQTLMDKIRGNLDYLHSAGAQLRFIRGVYDNPASPEWSSGEMYLSYGDWRDRTVRIIGVVHQGHYNDYNKVYPGGSSDDKIGDEYTALVATSMYPIHFDGWFYAAAGCSSMTGDPKITASHSGSFTTNMSIWADSSAGYLKLGFSTNRADGYRNFAWHLMAIYSEDVGGH